MKFPENQVERLPNVYVNILTETNPKQAVLIRRRQGGM
jgi:hypothetical protein